MARQAFRIAVLLLGLLSAGSPSSARDNRIADRVDRAVASGAVFLRDVMRPEALTVLDAWAKGGSTGAVARQLAPRLNGLDVAGFMAILAAQPGARKSDVDGIAGHGRREQVMAVWEWPDGSIIRFKPEGDRWRSAPTYSIEVKDTRRLDNASARQAGIAFKLDPKARPVPTGPREVAVPPDLPRAQIDDYVDAVMDLGHRTLRR